MAEHAGASHVPAGVAGYCWPLPACADHLLLHAEGVAGGTLLQVELQELLLLPQ